MLPGPFLMAACCLSFSTAAMLMVWHFIPLPDLKQCSCFRTRFAAVILCGGIQIIRINLRCIPCYGTEMNVNWSVCADIWADITWECYLQSKCHDISCTRKRLHLLDTGFQFYNGWFKQQIQMCVKGLGLPDLPRRWKPLWRRGEHEHEVTTYLTNLTETWGREREKALTPTHLVQKCPQLLQGKGRFFILYPSTSV